jgi:hypothetical protein
MPTTTRPRIKNLPSIPSGSAVGQSPGRSAAKETTYDNEASVHAAVPGVRYDHVDAGPSEAHELTPQQRQERLEELAKVFVDIFVGLSPEQRARYMSEDTEQQSGE